MTAPTNGIINTSKLTLRHWRDVRNRKHPICVPGRQKALSPYLSSTCNTFVQKRWASASKALAYPSKHRLPQSDIPATAAAGLRRTSATLLRTLNQTRLHTKDYVDLTGRVSKSVRFLMAPEDYRVPMRYFHPRRGGHKHISFPPDSHGFFYWHIEADAPPLSGQVRFRTTTSSDPATFPSGRDLQLPDGRMWNISIFDIAHGPHYSGLRAQLLSERLITAKVLGTALNISCLEGARTIHPATGSLLIWKFGQRFLVDLQSTGMYLWVIGSSTAGRLRLRHLFSVQGSESGSSGIVKRVNQAPFTGRALVQFERSTLPEHKGTRTVVLRIVEAIGLTKLDGSDPYGMPEPKHGGLVMSRRDHVHWTPWSVDVDRLQPGGKPRSSSKALAILFDNEADPAVGSRGSGES